MTLSPVEDVMDDLNYGDIKRAAGEEIAGYTLTVGGYDESDEEAYEETYAGETLSPKQNLLETSSHLSIESAIKEKTMEQSVLAYEEEIRSLLESDGSIENDGIEDITVHRIQDPFQKQRTVGRLKTRQNLSQIMSAVGSTTKIIDKYNIQLQHEDTTGQVVVEHMNLLELFKEVDQDGNGHLDHQEMIELVHKFCVKTGNRVTVSELREAILRFDYNNDGNIDMDEWTDFVHNYLLKLLTHPAIETMEKGQRSKVIHSLEKSLFQKQTDQLHQYKKELKLQLRSCSESLEKMRSQFLKTKSDIKQAIFSFNRRLQLHKKNPNVYPMKLAEQHNVRNQIQILQNKRLNLITEYEMNVNAWKNKSDGIAVKLKNVLKEESSLESRLKRYQFVKDSVEMKAPTGHVILMFTDVQGSTQLWESDAGLASEVISMHNGVIRKVLEEHHGYEVKTEGDSFMVAFSKVKDAVECAIAIQLALLEAKWNPKIYEEDVASIEYDDSKNRRVIFRGLRVRIGLNSGNPICITDPTTGRGDYFGPVVNKAARIEGQASGGHILISSSVWEDLKILMNGGYVSNFIVKDIGLVELKGIQPAERLRLILPPKLEYRIDVNTQMSQAQKDLLKMKKKYEKQKMKNIQLQIKLRNEKFQAEEVKDQLNNAKRIAYQRLQKKIDKLEANKKSMEASQKVMEHQIKKLQQDKRRMQWKAKLSRSQSVSPQVHLMTQLNEKVVENQKMHRQSLYAPQHDSKELKNSLDDLVNHVHGQSTLSPLQTKSFKVANHLSPLSPSTPQQHTFLTALNTEKVMERDQPYVAPLSVGHSPLTIGSPFPQFGEPETIHLTPMSNALTTMPDQFHITRKSMLSPAALKKQRVKEEADKERIIEQMISVSTSPYRSRSSIHQSAEKMVKKKAKYIDYVPQHIVDANNRFLERKKKAYRSKMENMEHMVIQGNRKTTVNEANTPYLKKKENTHRRKSSLVALPKRDTLPVHLRLQAKKNDRMQTSSTKSSPIILSGFLEEAVYDDE